MSFGFLCFSLRALTPETGLARSPVQSQIIRKVPSAGGIKDQQGQQRAGLWLRQGYEWRQIYKPRSLWGLHTILEHIPKNVSE